jgi:hypothetical protein
MERFNEPAKDNPTGRKPVTFLSLPGELRQAILFNTIDPDEFVTKSQTYSMRFNYRCDMCRLRNEEAHIKKWAALLQQIHSQLIDDVELVAKKWTRAIRRHGMNFFRNRCTGIVILKGG